MGRRAVVLTAAALAGLCGGCEVLFPASGGDAPPPGIDGAVTDDAGAEDATPPDALPDGPSEDIDGDGWPNGADNCPSKPNELQGDEDADGFGDVCDKCIGIPDPLQTDSDLDSVGDACDLRPGPMNQVLVAYFVEGGGPTPLWTAASGGWMVTTESARSAGQADLESNLMYDGLLPADELLWVEVGMSDVTVNAGGQLTPMVGIWIDAQPTPPMPTLGHRCALRKLPTTVRLSLMRRQANSNVAVADSPATQLLDAARVNLSAARNSQGIGCLEFLAGSEITLGEAPYTAAPRIGLDTSYANATFDYVIIYREPPP